MKTLIIAALVGIAALQPAAARAQGSDSFTVSIPLHGIDLSTPAGAAALRERAAKVARLACYDSGHIGDVASSRACRADFMRKIDTQIALAVEHKRTMASR